MAVPARQSWLITQLLGETTDVIAPAQLLVGQLQSDLANELAALQSYALAGDRASLDSYRMRADDSEERVASLERLAVRLDEPSAAHARALRYPMDRWHRPNDALIERGAARSDFTTVLERGQTWYDSSARAVAELSSSLANQVALRDERVRALERLSLAANAGLVLAALVAMSGVLVLTFQEKRLSAALYHRAVEEAALGQMARRLSVAVTHDEAMLSITEGTLAVTGASSVLVEWKVSRSSTISMVMTGEAPSLPCKRSPYRGSLTEMIVMHGASAVTADVEALHARLPALPGDAGRRRVELVVPLFSGQKTRGALVLLRDPSAPTPREDGRRQLQLVSSLASAALRRVDGRVAEQRALREARGRAVRETALREAAEALADAYTIDDVTQRIARAALRALRGRGAFVVQIASRAGEPREVTVKSVIGDGVPPVNTRRALVGSYTERVTDSGEPMLVDDLVALEPEGSFGGVPYPGGSAIVLPLNDGSAPVGALFVLSSLEMPFGPSAVVRADVFAHLATLAYEKVRLLEQAHERRRALERVAQSRSRLMRGFSHDVKNPIGAADGFAELLGMGIYGDLTAAQPGSVERMRRSIHTALALIDDLHELARAETGVMTLVHERVDLAEIARALSEEYHAAAAARGLSLSMRVEGGDTVVETDGTRVRQIAANLLSNAIKYTDSGYVEVRVRREAADAPSGAPASNESAWALLEIADSGIGIAEDKQGYIFEEFSRLNTGERTGAGLGLAISKLLAQALGGRISVRSEVGVGSTFTLWLPPRWMGDTATSPSHVSTTPH